MTTGIYRILNKINEKSYVGSAVSIAKRWAFHRYQLNAGLHHNRRLQRSWNKYGSGAFAFIIVEQVADKADLLRREQHWLDQQAKDDYNDCRVAGSSLGRRFSEETKEKMRNAAKSRGPVKPESRLKMSAAQRGRKHSAEHVEKRAAQHRGKTISEQTRLAVAEANRRRVFSQEERARRSVAMKKANAARRQAQCCTQTLQLELSQ